MLHIAVEAAFDDLLAAWRAHEARRSRRTTDLSALAESRLRLDDARNRMHLLRTAIYPEPNERDGIVESLWCEALDAVVHLRWSDQDRTRPGNFRCPCGNLTPIDWDQVANPSRRSG